MTKLIECTLGWLGVVCFAGSGVGVVGDSCCHLLMPAKFSQMSLQRKSDKHVDPCLARGAGKQLVESSLTVASAGVMAAVCLRRGVVPMLRTLEMKNRGPGSFRAISWADAIVTASAGAQGISAAQSVWDRYKTGHAKAAAQNKSFHGSIQNLQPTGAEKTNEGELAKCKGKATEGDTA